MKILVIDRDTLTSQTIRSKLEGMGHTVIDEPVKNTAIERMGKENFDAVLFDPAPLNNARPVVLGIRRSVKNYPYVILMSPDMDQEEALKSGANDVLAKPIDTAQLDATVNNAGRLTKLIKRIGDENEDFPSAGGVISKSAFNQLFRSGIDRADRYGEQTFLVFIGIENYKEILEMDGAYALDFTAAKLSQYLVRMRRQSDIIAQTARSEYCLMLQRPLYESEPVDAANRFAEALGRLDDMCSSSLSQVKVYVRLVNLPIGSTIVEHVMTYTQQKAAGVGV
jgi:CheY-like chemotaxis protein